eukprot:gene11784-13004_t
MATDILLSNSFAHLIIGTADNVLLKCSCSNLRPISKLYFCRHCTKLRCSQCVSHEVDSYYCPNCLENMPSAEAKLKKNRCGNCFDCPSCFNTLVIRATSAPVITSPLDPKGEDVKPASASKKMHYLFCSFCRWTSRDAGLDDQPTASGGWPELEHPNAKQISTLIDYYKQVAHQEKLEKEKKKLTKRKTYLHLMDRYGFALNLGKKKSGSPSAALASAILGKSKVTEITVPVVTESVSEVEELSEDYYTKQVILDQTPSIQQRLTNPCKQAFKSSDLYPRHKQMLVRRSMRCKECEHNLSKPEFNPSSVKFKIQLGALIYVPQLKISSAPSLEAGKEGQIILSVTNPVESKMQISFRQVEEGDEDFELRTAEIDLPKVTIPLAAKDATEETFEFDAGTEYFDDDPKVIQSRQGNKVWFFAKVKPIQSPSEGVRPPKEEKGKAQKKPAKEKKHENPKSAPVKEAQRDDAPKKSKAELKAERRARQEAQRAAKQAAKGGSSEQGASRARTGSESQGTTIKQKSIEGAPGYVPKRQEASSRVSYQIQMDDKKVQKKEAKKLAKQQVPIRSSLQKKVNLFSHLHQYEKDTSLTRDIKLSGAIHPVIIRLGLQYANGIIHGSNSRCIALLGAFRKVITDYSTPPSKELSRDLESRLKPYISFLTQCRPLSVSMGNAIKYLKMQITQIPPGMPEQEAKTRLIESIDSFVKERILLPAEAISKTYANAKINNGDVILTYSCSSLIVKILKDAYHSGKKFRVIVVDSRPKFEGRETVRRLVSAGIKCSYVLINAVSYILKEVTSVFLGAHALLANGYVMSRIGSSIIAMVAKSHNVPVLVCCETYKFCERVQTDAFVFNELGDPDEIVGLRKQTRSKPLEGWRDINSLYLLNLIYDVMPSSFVDIVVTELGTLPCTSVPAVLRMRNPETYNV